LNRGIFEEELGGGEGEERGSRKGEEEGKERGGEGRSEGEYLLVEVLTVFFTFFLGSFFFLCWICALIVGFSLFFTKQRRTNPLRLSFSLLRHTKRERKKNAIVVSFIFFFSFLFVSFFWSK
jgi:hypothetical protein